MAHSSIMMRKTVFDQAGGYIDGLAQDYDLWLRVGAITDLVNLPDVLLLYRIWEGSITRQHSARTNAKSVELVQQGISVLLGESVPVSAAAAMRAVMELDKSTWPDDPAAIRDTAGWLVRVCRVYLAKERASLARTDVRIIKNEVAFRLILLALRAARSSPREGVRLMLSALLLYPLVIGRVIAKMGTRMYRYIGSHRSPSPSRMGRGSGGGAD
jgi:hypothetical protein